MCYALSLMFVQDTTSVEGDLVSLFSTAMAFYHCQSEKHMLIKLFTVFAHDLLGLFINVFDQKEIKWEQWQQHILGVSY